MKITINILEAASELANNELESFYQGEIYLTDENDEETTYTDEAQEVFDELFDKYYSLLENISIKD